MNLRQYFIQATDRLPSGPDDNPRLEAEVLIRHALGIGREQFFAELERELSPGETGVLDALVDRRASHEPLAYITGHREFYALEITVNEHVLIPRQETELLVELALEFAKPQSSKLMSIVDVGAGSGAIAIALAFNLPDASVLAIELDDDALDVARRNIAHHELSERITLLHGNLLEPVQEAVDVIVSNPPYIPTGDIQGLPKEVQQEPRQALDGGADGLDVLRSLLEQAPAKLKSGGCLLVELSPDQMAEAQHLARLAFPTADVSHSDDLLGLARVLIVKTK